MTGKPYVTSRRGCISHVTSCLEAQQPDLGRWPVHYDNDVHFSLTDSGREETAANTDDPFSDAKREPRWRLLHPMMEQATVTPETLAAVQAVQLELTGENATTLALRRPFDPVAHDLDASFRLTRFADLKGWGCESEPAKPKEAAKRKKTDKKNPSVR